MKKLMMVLGTWCLVLGAGWVQATPIMGTNTWIGAASGGSWNTSSNWRSVTSAVVTNVPAATTFNKNSYYVYDFSKLENDATVWNDCTNAIRIAGLLFGENQGTVTLKRWGGQNFYFNDVTGSGGNLIRVGTGTTVNFNLPHWDWENSNGQLGPEGATSVNFEGGGDFRYDVSELRIAAGTQFNLYDGTTLTVANNNPDNYGAGFYLSQIIFQDDDSVLNIKADNVRFQAIRSASGRAGKVALNGHTAGIVYGEGTSIGEIAFGGHFDGPGTLYVQGGNALKFTNAMPFRNGAALKVRTAEVAFAAGAALGADTALEMADNGRVAIGESATIKQLKGNGTMGAVTVANGKALTVGTSGSTGGDTYSARLKGDGKLVKDGADYTLTLDGVNTYAGGTEVKAGTLKIREPNAPPAVADGLVAYYRFDDPTDIYKDEIGSTDLEAMSGATITSVDGVIGGAVHFAKGTLIDPPPLRTAKNFGAAGFPINGEAISFATWVKVEEAAATDTQIMLYGQWTGGGVMYLFRDNNGVFTVSSAATVSTQSSGMTLKDGKWHHVAYTYDGSQAGNRVLYVDGVQKATGKNLVGASMNIVATDFLNLGGNGSYSYSGAMDELRIYNRVLSADEVDALYKMSMSTLEIVPAERVDEAANLPAPVAKYTFDDSANEGKDTSGNGYDLTKVGTTTYTTSRKGAYGGCVKFANKSYFKADTFPAKVPTSGSFTLSLRVQPAQVETPAYVFWGKSGSTTAQEFFWAGANNNQLAEQVGSFTTGNDIVLGELFSTTGGASSGTGNEASWINMVYVYNHLAKTLSAYRDGNLVGSKAYESSFAATPDVFYLGYRPDKGIYAQCYLDDVRIFDRALTPMQVKALTRSLETGSVGPSLPASGTVTIDAGATLEVLGAGHSIPTLEGAGTLEVPRLSSATLNNAANFSGAVTGLGSLYLNGKVGAGIDFSGFSGMMSLANEINVSSDALPVISSPNSVVALPSKGTLTITNGGASPSRFVIAEAQDFSGETSDFSGWTYSSANEWIKNVTFAIEQGDGVRRFVANVTYWLLDVPYRAWNETTRQMEDRVCAGCTIVTTETATFEDGRWYVVVGTVECGSIAVNGAAHLILMDGAKLTATAVTNEAGIAVAAGNSLTIYGQQLGTGELEATATGGHNSAGIGASEGQTGGVVTINGGIVTATGTSNGAGIGSGYAQPGSDDSSNRITINGGRIKATGDGPGAGLGGGFSQHGGTLVINGGTVDAIAGWNNGASLGNHVGLPDPLMRVEVNGGSIKADSSRINIQPVNAANAAVWCVTAKVEGLRVEKLRVEGLGSYGTNDIYAIEGVVYLWLPDGAHRFSISDGTTTNRYIVVVNGGNVAAERLGPIGFFANGTDVGDAGIGDGWVYFGRVLSLTDAKACVLSGEATNNEVQVHAAASGATAVLSNAVVFASERPAVVVTPGATLTVAANQVMRAGETPGTMRYATDCDQNSCVLAGPAVTVTVKDIPHVKDVVVSNRTETISKATVEGGTAYRVMKGDDVFVGYTVEEGCTSQSPNPLVYAAVENDVTVDANTIRILKNIPYRTWNETTRQMEDKVCTSYTVVTADTEIFADGQWYAVTGAVSRGTITVNGSAHLILCDGARLTCDGEKPNAYHCGEPGILLDATRTLSVYGQAEGSGTLEALGADDCAGIGSGAGDSPTAGGLTVDGGVVLATGKYYGAGIGGSNTFWWTNYGNGGTVTVNGGRVTANGGPFAAGIGGGSQGRGAAVTIRGGTVASQGGQGGFGHGNGYGVSDNGSLTIDGGSVKAQTAAGLAKNSATKNVYCVTAKVEGLNVERLNVEGLGNYGTNDIYAIDGRAYLWLPDGTHLFSVSDGVTTNRYLAVVNGVDVAAERLGPIGFFANGTDVGDAGVGDGWIYFGRVLSLTNAISYVLSGAASNNEVQVNVAASGATAVLSNAVVFASGRPAVVFASGRPAVVVAQGATLTVAANQALMAGETPETMRYATDCGQNSCVLAGPAVTVTVKDISHVTGFTVSNAVETITNATGEASCRVMAGDDVFVGYVVEEGYFSKSANPLVYAAIKGDVIVDEKEIQIRPRFIPIPYRVWNVEKRQMEDKVCTSYTVVTNETATFEDGKWYAVTNDVSCGTITVSGAAHLILCDGARMTANGVGNHAGIQVAQGCALAIYGQTFGTGELIAQGGWHSAGIGAVERSETAEGCGAVVIHGGMVTANGGDQGAGIGGGFECAGGTVTVYGGRVCANGGNYAAGIGGGSRGAGGVVTINGGTVSATHSYTTMDIGGGATGNTTVAPGAVVTINGGSVGAGTIDNVPSNGVGRVYCVTVKCEGLKVEKLNVEGLDDYGTNDIYAVDNRVYLWLPKGTHWFTLSDGTTTYRYCAVVRGRAITVEPLGPVGFFVNGKDVGGGSASEDGWRYQEKVLTLEGAKTYVLSGAATNDEVQVKVATGGATVVLSNAVVFTSGRPALDVAQNAALQMAGGASFLGTAKNFAAVAVASNAKLAVDLAPDANRNEAMIGVFNSGSAAAIEGVGSAVVKGGTFFVWSDNTAVGLPEFTCDPDEIMQAGDTPEEMRYTMTDWRFKPCVLVGPAVTVTVLKDIPHVSGFTVSNDVQAIQGILVPPGATYRVMLGDDLFVGYTVEEGYTSQAANPLVYVDVEKDFTVDANTIRILKNIPYRAWNATTRQMEDKVCTSYTVVMNAMAAFEDGKWYAVTNEVGCGAITVSGAAHLILAAGAMLTANGITGGSLAVHGQPNGCGALKVSGEVSASLACDGGVLSAGTLSGESLAVVGGTLAADAVSSVRKTIDGGSVKATQIGGSQPVNRANQPLYRVTVKCEGLKVGKLNVEGLNDYGTNDIYAVDNRVYLWLPKGTHRFTLSDGTTTYRYCAVVRGRAITVEPLGPVGFFVNGVDIGKEGAGAGWVYMGKNLTLNGAGPYVLSGEAANDEVHIHVISPNAATVILSNAVVFVSENPPALNVNQNTSLLMAGGTSYIAATNDIAAVTVGANAALTVGLAPDADETESMICAFNYGNRAAVDGAGSVAVNGGTLAVCADRMASAAPLTRAANAFCMLAGSNPETAKVVDKYNGEAYVRVTAAIAPVTPGTPVGPFTTSESATNAMRKAVLAPRDDVEAALGSGAARQTYCNMFGFAVTGGGESWFVEAVLYPEAWSNVIESAQDATLQLPVARIAEWKTGDDPIPVLLTNCVPGFYYSLFDGAAVTNIRAVQIEEDLNVLCGTDKKVVIPEVTKPIGGQNSGFFTIGVKETSDVEPGSEGKVPVPPVRHPDPQPHVH